MLIILIGGSCGNTDVLHLWIMVSRWWSWLVDYVAVPVVLIDWSHGSTDDLRWWVRWQCQWMTCTGESGGSASEWPVLVNQMAVLRKKREGDRKKRLRLYLLWRVCTLYVPACQGNYHTQLGSLCEIFWVLMNSVVCWFKGKILWTADGDWQRWRTNVWRLETLTVTYAIIFLMVQLCKQNLTQLRVSFEL